MPAGHAVSETNVRSSPTLSIRIAAYLAILFGIFGAMSGLAGAGTFIPYRHASTYNSQFAEPLTVIAAIGAVVSILGVVSGWGLLRARGWAWSVTMGVAAGCVASVAAMTAFWPASWGFLLVVAVAYALEVALLLLGRGNYGIRMARASLG